MLSAYFEPLPGDQDFFTGSLFDTWDTTGRRDRDADIVTADDLVAVTFLSVEVTPSAAYQVLQAQRAEVSALLGEIPVDLDFITTRNQIGPDWPAWQLEQLLRRIPGIGRTIASKLLARKRPFTVPIYDRVVNQVLGLGDSHWLPLRAAFDDGRLSRTRLEHLRQQVGLDERVTPLRILDVIAWMDGSPDRRQRALVRAGLSMS